MTTLIAHNEVAPVLTSASGALLTPDKKLLMEAAPCVFQSDSLISYRLFLENSASLLWIYGILAGVVCISLLMICLGIWWKRFLAFQNKIFLGAVGSILLSVCIFSILAFFQGERIFYGIVDSNHVHADVMVYAKGEKVDLSDPLYISSGAESLSNFAHIHDKMGSVMHVHSTGVTWGYALETLDIGIKNNCLVLGKEKRTLCTENKEQLRFYLNGLEVKDALKKPINDLDKFALVLGGEEGQELNKVLSQVTNNACLFSGKCPERGRLSDGAGCSSGK